MSESSSYTEINSNNNNSTGSTDSNNSCSSRTSNKACNECSEPYESLPWCYKCDLPKYSDYEYGSCNPEVDRLIEEAQEKLREKDSSYFFEWIPFNKFKDFRKIGEGGFGSVFKATFTDRSVTDTARIVALKCIKTSTTKGSCADFLEEVRIHVLCSLEFDTFLKIYGMTKNPKTLEYMMVTAYANRGNLRDYLEYNFKKLKWTEKLNYLANIATDLDTLHTKKFVHKDLHTGNILQHSPSNGEKIISYLTDFGLTKSYKDKTSRDFLASDEYIANSDPSKGKLHPEAIYVSRFIKFPKIENDDNDISDSDDDGDSTRDSKIVNLRVSNIIKEESFEELSNSPESLKSPRSPGLQGFGNQVIILVVNIKYSKQLVLTLSKAIPNFSSNQLRTVIETEENSQIDSQEGLTLSAVLNGLSLEDKVKYKINDEEALEDKEKYKINEEEVSLAAIFRSLDSRQLDLCILKACLNGDDITESHQSSDVPGEVDKNLEIVIIESE
ncbi:6809_t:CDS:10 [Entrophospora sp. SA101]|nr:6809_t:CDS:10 [Entrophospora sp. SA101]